MFLLFCTTFHDPIFMAKSTGFLRNRNLILASFIILIVINIIVGLTGVQGINQIIHITKKSKDKLIPAVEAAKIAEVLYRNRLSVEDHIVTTNALKYKIIETSIIQNRLIIDSLIVRYSEIYGSRDSENNLLKYRNRLNKYRDIERQVLKLSRENEKQQAMVMFLGQSAEIFQELIVPIEKVTDEHVISGEKSLALAEKLATLIKFIFYLSIGVSFVVVIIVGTFVGYSYVSG